MKATKRTNKVNYFIFPKAATVCLLMTQLRSERGQEQATWKLALKPTHYSRIKRHIQLQHDTSRQVRLALNPHSRVKIREKSTTYTVIKNTALFTPASSHLVMHLTLHKQEHYLSGCGSSFLLYHGECSSSTAFDGNMLWALQGYSCHRVCQSRVFS